MESQIGGAYEKQINFNFPVYYDGEVGKEIRLFSENTVEVVDLLSKGEIERYNRFRATMLIRHSAGGKKYLYDILDIKKETSNSLGS